MLPSHAVEPRVNRPTTLKPEGQLLIVSLRKEIRNEPDVDGIQWTAYLLVRTAFPC